MRPPQTVTPERPAQFLNFRRGSLQLRGMQRRVRPAGVQQLGVRAVLHDLPGLHHQDEVGVADSGFSPAETVKPSSSVAHDSRRVV